MTRNYSFLLTFMVALFLSMANVHVQAQTAQTKKTGTNNTQSPQVVKGPATQLEILYKPQNAAKNFTPPAYAPHMPNPYLEDYADKKPLWIQQYPEEYKRVVEEGSKK